MSARAAAYASIGISSLAVISCVLFVPMLMARITAVNDRIELSMSDFHQTTRDISRMLREVKATPGPLADSIFGNRHKRQAGGQCSK
jgi:hypothetical protein